MWGKGKREAYQEKVLAGFVNTLGSNKKDNLSKQNDGGNGEVSAVKERRLNDVPRTSCPLEPHAEHI